MENLKTSSDVLFILLGAVMVLAMHAGFAFLELGTVRRKNQVNALVKILSDFAVSTVAYFFIGYSARRHHERRLRDTAAAFGRVVLRWKAAPRSFCASPRSITMLSFMKRLISSSSRSL